MATMSIKSSFVGGKGRYAGRMVREVRACQHYRGYVYSGTENSIFGIKVVQLLHDSYLYSHTVMYFIP